LQEPADSKPLLLVYKTMWHHIEEDHNLDTQHC